MGAPGGMGLCDALWAVPRWLGLGFDAWMSRMVHAVTGAMAGGPPPSGPAMAGAPAASGRDWPATAPWSIRTGPGAGEGQAPGRAGQPIVDDGPEGGLAASGIKLVEYAVVSIRRCAEGILPGGGGEVLVTERMTGVDFAVWMVARYLQSDAYRAAVERDPAAELRHEDKRYLRVAYRVLALWPVPPKSGCGDRKADRLQDIREAIRGLDRPIGPAARHPASPPAPAATPPSEQPRRELAATARAEQARAARARAEQARAERARAGRARAERARAERARTERVRADRSEQARAERARAERVRAESRRAERARAETEPAAPEPAPAGPGEGEAVAATPEPTPEQLEAAAAVLAALQAQGGTAATSDLVRRTGLPRSRVRGALHDLEGSGRIRRSGEGLQTRYHEEGKP